MISPTNRGIASAGQSAMSAPSSQMPLFSVSDPGLQATASFSPTSSVSNTSYIGTWPRTGSKRPLSSHQSMSPLPNERNNASDGLQFITGTSPEDFKSRKNMTRVRKKAMGSYLKEKKPRGSPNEQQDHSRRDSAGSRLSTGSDQQIIIANSVATTQSNADSRTNSLQSTSFYNNLDVHKETPETPESPVSKFSHIPMDFVLPSAPIVMPSRTGVALPYDEMSPKPFQSIGKPLDPFRSMFQASHPRVSVEELKFHCSRSFGTKAMGIHWIPALVKSPHAFLSTLCIASAHYDAINERPVESVQTLALRQEVIHLISQNLVNPELRGDDHNIIALTQLIASEIIAGEDMTLDFHETGMEAMIKQRGGIEQLGMNGRLASTLSWVSLESAILREAKPRPMYSDYAASVSTRNYPNTATIPESPLYCPRSEFETIKRSLKCSAQAIDLLKDIRMMMDLFLHETKQSRHNSLSLKNIHKKITTQYLPISDIQERNILTSKDWKYEVIRIVAVLTSTSIINRVPLSEALNLATDAEKTKIGNLNRSTTALNDTTISPSNSRQDSPLTTFTTKTTPPLVFDSVHTYSHDSPTSTRSDSPTFLLKHLKNALQHSDLSECWSEMAGVLLWAALTAGAASRKSNDKVLKKWYKALVIRASIVLCFEHPEPMHASMLRMGELFEGVNKAKEGVDGGGKRRKS